MRRPPTQEQFYSWKSQTSFPPHLFCLCFHQFDIQLRSVSLLVALGDTGPSTGCTGSPASPAVAHWIRATAGSFAVSRGVFEFSLCRSIMFMSIQRCGILPLLTRPRSYYTCSNSFSHWDQTRFQSLPFFQQCFFNVIQNSWACLTEHHASNTHVIYTVNSRTDVSLTENYLNLWSWMMSLLESYLTGQMSLQADE